MVAGALNMARARFKVSHHEPILTTMKTDLSANKPASDRPADSLIDVLDQSQRAKELVVEAAEELASVNTELKQQLSAGVAQPAVEHALDKTVAVEDKVQDASKKLEIVNLALKDEVEERTVLESRLAAVTDERAAELHRLEEQLAVANERSEADRHAALHDVLTGLPNRVLLNDRLEHGLAQAARHGWSLAVMFVDLDNFKAVNDQHGHDIGDVVLCTIADRLRANMRCDDTVSRFGGDEFLYLLLEVGDQQTVITIAEKIIKAVELPCTVSKVDQVCSLSVQASIGIALYPKNGTTAEALIKSADTAMYAAKRTQAGYVFAP